MASKASLIVTPVLFRAWTTSPCWKCRSIALMAGVTKSFVSMSFSSTVDAEVFIFLFYTSVSADHLRQATLQQALRGRFLPSCPLRLFCYFYWCLTLLYNSITVSHNPKYRTKVKMMLTYSVLLCFQPQQP